MYDYHIHTTFSKDAVMDPEEGLITAINRGLKEIAITDHGEFNVWRPGNVFEDDIFDIDEYMSKIGQLKEKYKDKITVKIGLEVGLQREEKEAIDEFVNKNNFDFVIGSSHTINKIDLYFKKLYEGQDKKKAYEQYFGEVLEIVKVFDSYNVYGHLDLVTRYALGQYDDVALTNTEMEIVRDILKEIINKGKGIEVNTSGFRYGLNALNPSVDILKLYRKLGGEVITVGSDAHSKEHVGHMVPETYDLLRNLGYKYITTFEKMVPTFVKL